MEDQRLVKLLNKGIQFVRIAVVDTSNVVRLRVVPIAKFLQFIDSAERKGFFMCTGVMGLTIHADHIIAGLSPTISCYRDMRLVPDLPNGIDDLHRLTYGTGSHSLCMVDLEEKDHPGVPFSACTRSSLKRILKTAAEELGITFLVGFEIEVYFLEKHVDVAVTPIDRTMYSTSLALHSVRTSMMLDEIVQSIAAQGIEILYFHAECGPGQFEFVIAPYDPLTAADNLVRSRETIYNIAAKYDLKATLAPKVFADYAGSGTHCHISILESSAAKGATSTGPFAPQGINSLEESFSAGILKHLSSICAFTLPNVTSYNRTLDNCFAGSYICWGIENKEASLRLAYTPGVNRKFRFEVKSVDGTANPYLAVCAIIVAGLHGIRTKMQLDQKEMTGLPSEYEATNNSKLKKLPLSIEEAVRNLEEPAEYELYCKGMGKTLVDLFIAVRKEEAEYMRKLSDEDQLKFVIRNF